MLIRCAMYARYSSDQQRPESITDQIRHCRQEASRHPDWVVLDDQIYADETEPDTQRFIERRRDPEVPPWRQVGDFREYVHAYNVSWSDPAMSARRAAACI